MKIFITGASGFIGKHIVPLLVKDKHELLVLGRKRASKPKGQEKIKMVIGDLQDLSRIKKTIIRFAPQVCLHLAWEGIPDYSYERAKRNLDQSMGLIHMIVNETTCAKIIASGSSWEYGKTSFFTWAKNAVYTGGSLLCAKRGIDFVWLRIFFAFGPGQRKQALIPTLYDAFKNGRRPEIKNPQHAQDFIYVTDVAEALRRAVKKPVGSGVYDIGRQGLVSVSQVRGMVEKQMAHTSKFRRATGWQALVSVPQGIKKHLAFMEAS